MSSKVKIIKQNTVTIGVDETRDLSQFRTKFRYEGPSLHEWVNSLETEEKNDIIVPTVLTYFKNPDPEKPFENPLPSELLPFVNYMLEEKRIPQSEVRGYTFHVIKPLKERNQKSLTYENIVEQCKVYVSDRFIFVDGSRELLKYVVIDVRKFGSMVGLQSHQQMVENIEEQVREKDVICMDLQAAISMRLHVNNKTSYDRPYKKGFKKGVKISKNPMNRYVVVLDIIATTDKVNKVLKNKTEMLEEIMDNKPDSQQAKVIRSFTNKADTIIAESKEEKDNEEIPELVKEPCEDIHKNSSFYVEDVDDDVMDNL